MAKDFDKMFSAEWRGKMMGFYYGIKYNIGKFVNLAETISLRLGMQGFGNNN